MLIYNQQYICLTVTGTLLVLELKCFISIKVYPIQGRSKILLSNNSVYNLMPAHLAYLPRYFYEL